MILVCHRPFGLFVPGDEVEVPDGAIFDGHYFREKPEADNGASDKEDE